MAITDEEFRAFAMNPRRPIPGQSFTTNPETPPVYDTAPEFTNKQEALRHFFSLITDMIDIHHNLNFLLTLFLPHQTTIHY